METRDGVKANAKHLAREAESSFAFETLARAGYVANGVIHALIGAIVIVIASGGRGEGDQLGAMKAVAGAPVGFVVLWLIAIGLWALALWHVSEGILARDLSDDIEGAARKWSRRLSEFGQAAVFVALGGISAAVAMGARPDGEKTAEGASRSLLQIPGGHIVLGLVGVGIGVGGVAFVVMGVRRSFRNRIRIPDGGLGWGFTTLGVVGFVAKGIALLIVGVLLGVAAVRADARVAGGLDGAVDAVLELPLGPALAWVVGLGLLAYGVFTIARARFAWM
ncbi:DUF1206 domain-containing protein [Microbacterium trichothecenolyticum]|uniref:DUF1206 domain-containing protein n=1 Tax=Microbacterium trichothecenolyticum TaxID=69370 RepID=A0A0M2HKF1_MICTR|nr:DUF1206 domain-containing protein [Microbacterium trichothecenolyticum]KJL45353.1 hypothetical protein RS82_00246 [Microbacterium trichothecenolyticum]